MAFQSSYKGYISLLKSSGFKFFIALILFGIIIFFLTKLKSKKPLLALFVILIGVIGYFTSYIAIIVTISYYFIILCCGNIICLKFNRNNSLISLVAIGYSSFAFLFSIPFLNNSIPIIEYYYFILIVALILIFKTRKLLLEHYFKEGIDSDFVFDPKVILLLVIYLYSASITSFMWDDINAYLYFPLQSIIENNSILSPELPGSLIFQSLHSLAFTAALGVWSNYDYTIVYFYKFFNLSSYILAFISLWEILKKIYDNLYYAKLTFFIITTSCIWFIELTSNYTDFPVLLLSIYCLHLLVKINFNNSKILDFFDYVVFSLFVAVTLKSLVLVLPLVAFDFYRSILNRKINLNFLLIPIPVFPSLIRNFIYSGNPTFPAGNNLWKSNFFSIDPSSIVVSKFWPPNQVDFSLFVNFLTISDYSLRNFYSSLGNFYSPIFYFLFPFTALLFLFKYINIDSNRYLIFGFFTFFLTIYLPGAQHRYFIPSYCFLLIGIIYIYHINYSQKIKLSGIFSSLLIYLLIFLFPLSPYVSNKVHNKDGVLFSAGFRDWNEKIIFYTKVNNYFSLNNEHPKILLHYLQDKLFLKNSILIEYDWYDYSSVKELIEIMDSRLTNIERFNQAQIFLCQNGFTHVVLSSSSPFLALKLNKIHEGTQQSLYRIECLEK